ncbi:hypothetical protein GCM10010345_19700 [Streptomyces canarius]|uniref:Uncharacterized protein n=1 Tax=Streptomyces canarius TaxID=285453 RepID=A0ABQ3CH83_9ACTN|nr:hypothetical protein GCM10010345_19700 [Streptomyces canarius]
MRAGGSYRALPLAGALAVPARVVTVWQVVRGPVCGVGLTLTGCALRSSIPGLDRWLLPLVGLIVAVSLIPLAAELYRCDRRAQAEEVRG